MVQVNGEQVDAAGMTLAAYLQEHGYRPERVAVERNGEIAPKGDYANLVLQDGDIVEIVHFVGGGCGEC